MQGCGYHASKLVQLSLVLATNSNAKCATNHLYQLSLRRRFVNLYPDPLCLHISHHSDESAVHNLLRSRYNSQATSLRELGRYLTQEGLASLTKYG